MRFLVSYAAVIPAAALLLFAAKRFDWSHLTAATASTWAIKLMFTSTVYLVIARGTAHIPVAAPLPPSSEAQATAGFEYRPAKGAFAHGALSGAVVLKDTPAPGAVILIDRPLRGRAGERAHGPAAPLGGRRPLLGERLSRAGRADLAESRTRTLLSTPCTSTSAAAPPRTCLSPRPTNRTSRDARSGDLRGAAATPTPPSAPRW